MQVQNNQTSITFTTSLAAEITSNHQLSQKKKEFKNQRINSLQAKTTLNQAHKIQKPKGTTRKQMENFKMLFK